MDPRTIYLIKRAEIEVTSRMNKALEQYDITPIQFVVLYFVNQDKNDLSSAQLSRRFSMTPQSMNELVTVLLRKKLVKKTVDAAHKRILRISLTAKGIKLLADCNVAMDAVESELLEDLNSIEIQQFRDVIGKILDSSRRNG